MNKQGYIVGESAKPVILVVEDDNENQKFLKIFLKRKFEVFVCDNSEECYRILEQEHIDIILMDISIKGTKDGLVLTKELKSNQAYQNIPIVGLSAHAFRKDIDNAYKAGVDLFITKPTDATNLLEKLFSFIDKNKNYPQE